VSIANQGTAAKFHRLAHVKETYPEGMLTRGGLHISTIRAFGPQHETKNGVTIDVTVLERCVRLTAACYESIVLIKDTRTPAKPSSQWVKETGLMPPVVLTSLSDV
jgi:hypothetical protein